MVSCLKFVVFTQTVSQHFKNILFGSWNTCQYHLGPLTPDQNTWTHTHLCVLACSRAGLFKARLS